MNLSLGPPPRVASVGLFARLGTAFGRLLLLLLAAPALFPVLSDMVEDGVEDEQSHESVERSVADLNLAWRPDPRSSQWAAGWQSIGDLCVYRFSSHFFLSLSFLSLPAFVSLISLAMSEPEHLRMTYNDIHKLIRASAEKIAEFKPDMLIAIGETAGN